MFLEMVASPLKAQKSNQGGLGRVTALNFGRADLNLS